MALTLTLFEKFCPLNVKERAEGLKMNTNDEQKLEKLTLIKTQLRTKL